jgi:hypothetical protein
MDIIYYLFAAAIFSTAVLAAIAIWAPRKTWIRVSAICITVLFVPLIYIELMGLLSKPKPMAYEWWESQIKKAEILGVSLHEDEAIYIWLRLDGSVQPRYYFLPWRQKLAEKLEDHMEAAVKSNSALIVSKPFFKKSFEEFGDLNVDVIPPPKPPQKSLPFTPRIFNPRAPPI